LVKGKADEKKIAKGKRIDKSNHKKTNKINSPSKAEEAQSEE